MLWVKSKAPLDSIICITAQNNFERAIFIATLNAVMRELGEITGTVHCRDKEPAACADELVDYVGERFGQPLA